MRARGRRGFTLLELMLVMLIMALVLGIGAGLFARIDFSDRVARPLVESVLRSAQNWSIARGAPALVRIDPQAGTIRAEGQLVVGTWHFEALPLQGAFGLESVGGGGKLVEDGFQGRALSFVDAPPRSRVDIPVQQDPAFDLRQGFSLRCALRVEPSAAGQVLVIGEVVALEVGENGALSAWFVPERLDQSHAPMRGGKIQLRGGAGTLVPRRWEVVELDYDRRDLELRVDGALVASVEESAYVWKLEGPLSIAPGQTPFAGALDNLVVGAVGASEEAQLPRNTHFAADVPREIVFQPGGGLDRTRHREAQVVGIERDDGTKSSVTVQPYGTVE